MIRPLRAVAVLVLAFALVACARPPDATLRVGLSSAPTTLDPRYATDATSWRLCRLLFEAPADFDAQFLPRPALMRWAVLSPTRYRFVLNGEPRFSDGRPVSAADVAATYRAVLDPARASPHRASLTNIREIAVIDARTVDFELIRPDPLFPGLLVIGVLPAAAASAPAWTLPPPGSGAFVLDGAPDAKRYRLKRRRDGLAVELLVVESEITRALKLARGELDLLQGGITPENVAWLAAREGVAVAQVSGTTFSYVGFNFASGPTRDPRVRQAIAMAIDRERIVSQIFRGQARRAEAMLIPTHWAGVPDLQASYPYDPVAARAALAAAGFGPQRPLRLSYKTSSDPLRLRIATVFKAQLAEVGIDLRLESYDWGTFYADIKAGRFELYGLSWVGLQLPDIFRYALHSAAVPPAGANRGRYANPQADRLIEAAEASTAPASRAAHYRALQRRLAVDLPFLPLWFEDFVIVRRTRVLGYDTNASGDFDALARVTLQEPP